MKSLNGIYFLFAFFIPDVSLSEKESARESEQPLSEDSPERKVSEGIYRAISSKKLEDESITLKVEKIRIQGRAVISGGYGANGELSGLGAAGVWQPPVIIIRLDFSNNQLTDPFFSTEHGSSNPGNYIPSTVLSCILHQLTFSLAPESTEKVHV